MSAIPIPNPPRRSVRGLANINEVNSALESHGQSLDDIILSIKAIARELSRLASPVVMGAPVMLVAHAASHQPSGTDPLAIGFPAALSTAASAGVADSFARSDHVHVIPDRILSPDALKYVLLSNAGAVVPSTNGGATLGADGLGFAGVILKDTAAAFESTLRFTNAGMLADNILTIDMGNADRTLTLPLTAVPAFATPAIVLGTAAAEGVAATVIRSDATLALFDGTTPAAIAAAAATGVVNYAARSDHAHIYPVALRATANASTLTLTDTATDQTLTGSLGDIAVSPASGIVLNTNKAQANQISAFRLNDVVGNGAGADRTSGFLLRIVNQEGVAAWNNKETAFAVSAGALPKLLLYRPGVDTVTWLDVNNLQFNATLDANGLPTGTPGLGMNVAGSLVRWTGAKTNMEFIEGSLGATSNLSFEVNGANATVANPTIKFVSNKQETAGTSTPIFQFLKTLGWYGTEPFLRCSANAITGVEIGQTFQLGLKDTSAAFLVDLVFTSSTALTARRQLTIDMVDAARTLKLTGNATLADWFDQSVKTTASPTHAGLTVSDAGNVVLGTTTGTKIGTGTTQKLGFYNATPVVQRSDAGALTDSTGGSVDGTLVDVGVIFSQANINNNFADCASRINAIRTALRDLGLMA